jgi:surfactin synthase thioesterase subunit
LLRARHLTFRISPGAFLADRSLLDASNPALPADRSACAPLSARTKHELLRARHLAFRIAPGAFLADRSLLAASRPALRADCSALNA